MLGTTRSGLAARGDDEVDGLEPLLARREAREPLAYILGEWGFRRLTLKTDARALVPRPETETLVERALALVAETERAADPRRRRRLRSDRARAQGRAARRGRRRRRHLPDALALARENAERLGLDVELREQDGVEAAGEGWDLVVANPPYVASLDGLQAELQWEPEVALIGADAHERLARAADARFIVFEVGDGQAEVVGEILPSGLGATCVSLPDLTGTRPDRGRREVNEAVAASAPGQAVILPTDTVYGLCALPGHEDVLYELKGRDRSKPIALIAADIDALHCPAELDRLCSGATSRARTRSSSGVGVRVRTSRRGGGGRRARSESSPRRARTFRRAGSAASRGHPGGDPRRGRRDRRRGELPGTPSTVIDRRREPRSSARPAP